ncbi:uncharacterized protein [Aegilops tauschii subsp. strangulata]|uniref:uncharacterized protein n=1 Tax=Aegilops tauschii subsp. strangulata TaxID=200361 RepID=UPI003CC8BB9C
MVAGAVAGRMAVNAIVNIAALALCIKQTFMDSAYNDGGELVFHNFSLAAKSVSCSKLFITAYHAVHTEGSEMFGLVCLLGFFLLSYAITTHLKMDHKAWAKTRIIGMATLMASGVFLLCRGMLIPKDHAWHTIAVQTIIILIVFLEACVLLLAQIKENGDTQHLLPDLLMKSVETSINIYRLNDFMQQKRNPWDAEKILHLVGSGMSVLIGAYQIGWIIYKVGIKYQVIEWLRKLPQVYTGKEEQATGAAIKDDRDADVAEKAVAKGEVEMV